ncbi:MAG: helix-turn-helix transcriptional regulator [Thermoguttaceae bacterium]
MSSPSAVPEHVTNRLNRLDKDLLTGPEVAKALGIPQSKFITWVSFGWVPKPREVDGALRWSAEDVRAWVNGECLVAGVRRPELFAEFDAPDGLPRGAA